MSARIVIVGAGLSGLACARALTARGVEAVVLEADDAVGGRVRTQRQDGFLIDRGEVAPEPASCSGVAVSTSPAPFSVPTSSAGCPTGTLSLSCAGVGPELA